MLFLEIPTLRLSLKEPRHGKLPTLWELLTLTTEIKLQRLKEDAKELSLQTSPHLVTAAPQP